MLVFNPTDPAIRASMDTMRRSRLLPYMVFCGGADDVLIGSVSGPLFAMELDDTRGHEEASNESWLAHVQQQAVFFPHMFAGMCARLRQCIEVHVHVVLPLLPTHPMYLLMVRKGMIAGWRPSAF